MNQLLLWSVLSYLLSVARARHRVAAIDSVRAVV